MSASDFEDGSSLVPDSQVTAKPYQLLVQALGRPPKMAAAKYAWNKRERLGQLRNRDDVIALHAMRWPDKPP
ncbi:Ku protein [Streptomyces sp. WSLK1-4]|uniref:Ku protein n=1 Tax=Streptomyces sp. WSLK1-4 TaxID=3375474 RepID=UPI00378D6D29